MSIRYFDRRDYESVRRLSPDDGQRMYVVNMRDRFNEAFLSGLRNGAVIVLTAVILTLLALALLEAVSDGQPFTFRLELLFRALTGEGS